MTTWDPSSYDRNTRFVSDLGIPVLELLLPKLGEAGLDLGCGDGVLTSKLKNEFGCRVVGVDSSEEMAKAARSLGVDVTVANGQDLKFDEEFDAVFSNAALHWMNTPDDVISGVFASLKPHGRFVGEFGGHGNIKHLRAAMRQGLAERSIDPNSIDPWYFPSVEEYRCKLENAGFFVKHIELIERPTPLPTGVIGWIDSVSRPFLDALETTDQRDFITSVENRCRPYLYDDENGWFADYVRLRFSAIKSGHS